MKARSGTRTGVTKGCAGLGRCGGCWLNRPSVGSMSFGKGMAHPVSGPWPSTGRARRRRPVGKRLARSRADRASDQAERIHTWEPDHGRGAITAEQDGAVTAVLARVPTAAWQEPEQGGGDQGAEAVPPMDQTKAAFRLSLKREARPPPDLFDAAAPPRMRLTSWRAIGRQRRRRRTRGGAGTINGAKPRSSTRNEKSDSGGTRCRGASPEPMPWSSGSACWRTPSSSAFNASPVRPRGRRRRSRRSGGSSCRGPGAWSSLRDRWW